MGGVCTIAVNLSSSSPDKELWSELGLFLRPCWLQKRDAPGKPLEKRRWDLGSWAWSHCVRSTFTVCWLGGNQGFEPRRAECDYSGLHQNFQLCLSSGGAVVRARNSLEATSQCTGGQSLMIPEPNEPEGLASASFCSATLGGCSAAR